MNDQSVFDVFEREKELCELFRQNEENKSVYISYNVSSESMVIWVHFDKEDNWNWRRREVLVTTLIKNFKLDKIGYKSKPNVLRYKSPHWDSYEFTCKYYTPCPKVESDVFFSDESFLEYNNEYDF